MIGRSVLLAGMIALSSACAFHFKGCNSDDPPAEVHFESRPAAKIDPAMQGTAAEFSSRLTRYDGTLLELTRTGDSINAYWTSNKCDSYEPEIIDLLISVHRTLTESPSIRGQRVCEARTRTFKIAGNRFQQYRTGQINDPQILGDVR